MCFVVIRISTGWHTFINSHILFSDYFGISYQNPLVVFSSNLFAIMGLRSLYTILSQAATDLKYLEPAVALVLGFIGTKMIAEYVGFVIPTAIALGVVATLLGSGIALSVWEREKAEAESSSSE